ncbi:MAG: riboflavin kinase [bacterium]|nr:riboflavin kinase [bacterium]
MSEPLCDFRGRVVEGDHYGRALGFPTANIEKREFKATKCTIPVGIYAGTARIVPGAKVYRAGIVIGPREKDDLPKIEAHLLDFSGNLYGKELHLSLFVYLRPYRNFKGEGVLKEQISTDIQKVREVISL